MASPDRTKGILLGSRCQYRRSGTSNSTLFPLLSQSSDLDLSSLAYGRFQSDKWTVVGDWEPFLADWSKTQFIFDPNGQLRRLITQLEEIQTLSRSRVDPFTPHELLTALSSFANGKDCFSNKRSGVVKVQENLWRPSLKKILSLAYAEWNRKNSAPHSETVYQHLINNGGPSPSLETTLLLSSTHLQSHLTNWKEISFVFLGISLLLFVLELYLRGATFGVLFIPLLIIIQQYIAYLILRLSVRRNEGSSYQFLPFIGPYTTIPPSKFFSLSFEGILCIATALPGMIGGCILFFSSVSSSWWSGQTLYFLGAQLFLVNTFYVLLNKEAVAWALHRKGVFIPLPQWYLVVCTVLAIAGIVLLGPLAKLKDYYSFPGVLPLLILVLYAMPFGAFLQSFILPNLHSRVTGLVQKLSSTGLSDHSYREILLHVFAEMPPAPNETLVERSRIAEQVVHAFTCRPFKRWLGRTLHIIFILITASFLFLLFSNS